MKSLYLAAITAISLILSGCSDAPTVEYKILSDDSKRDIKRSIEVQLKERVEPEELTRIANKLFKSGFERTFISYRLEGDEPSVGYWATSHFNPKLEVRIIGADKATYDALLATPIEVDGALVGAWLINLGLVWKEAIYEKDGQYFIKRLYAKGKEKVEPIEASEVRGLKRFQDENGRDHGEYYIINRYGDLEMWGKNGKFGTAKKL